MALVSNISIGIVPGRFSFCLSCLSIRLYLSRLEKANLAIINGRKNLGLFMLSRRENVTTCLPRPALLFIHHDVLFFCWAVASPLSPAGWHHSAYQMRGFRLQQAGLLPPRSRGTYTLREFRYFIAATGVDGGIRLHVDDVTTKRFSSNRRKVYMPHSGERDLGHFGGGQRF